jgi:hypothetical protein
MGRGALHEATAEEVVAFWQRTDDLRRQTSAVTRLLPLLDERVKGLGEALSKTRSAPSALDDRFAAIRDSLYDIKVELNGTPEAAVVSELEGPTVAQRLSVATFGTAYSTYGPTPTHERSLELAQQQFARIREKLIDLTEIVIPEFERDLVAAGAPWVPGMPISILD